MSSRFALVTAVAVVLASRDVWADDDPTISSIRIEFAGGFSTVRSQSWEAFSDANGFWIRETYEAMRRTGTLKPRDAKAALTKEEWDGLVTLVKEQKLLEWKPQSRRVTDLPLSTLDIRGSAPVSLRWDGLLTNGAPFNAVLGRLQQLAKRTEDLPAEAKALKSIEIGYTGLLALGRKVESIEFVRGEAGLEVIVKWPAEGDQPAEARRRTITEEEWTRVAKIVYFRELNTKVPRELDLSRLGSSAPECHGVLKISAEKDVERKWEHRPDLWDDLTWLGGEMANVFEVEDRLASAREGGK